jgi:hypothetical protein
MKGTLGDRYASMVKLQENFSFWLNLKAADAEMKAAQISNQTNEATLRALCAKKTQAGAWKSCTCFLPNTASRVAMYGNARPPAQQHLP